MSDEIGYTAEDFRLVEERASRAVVVDVAENFAYSRVGFEEGEPAAPVGEDEFEFGGGLGEPDECLQGCGGVTARVGVPGGFGNV